MLVELDLPSGVGQLRFPKSLDRRLQHLLDKQDQGEGLTATERKEAAGLVDLAELVSLFKQAVAVARKNSPKGSRAQRSRKK